MILGVQSSWWLRRDRWCWQRMQPGVPQMLTRYSLVPHRPLIGLINTPPPPFHRYDDSLCYNFFIIIIMVSCKGSYIFEKWIDQIGMKRWDGWYVDNLSSSHVPILLEGRLQPGGRGIFWSLCLCTGRTLRFRLAARLVAMLLLLVVIIKKTGSRGVILLVALKHKLFW